MTTNNAVNNKISFGGFTFQDFILMPTDIMAMFATPHVLVPSPGPNKANIVKMFAGGKIYNSVQYTAGGIIRSLYSGTAISFGGTLSATLMTNALSNLQPNQTQLQTVTDLSSITNKDLVITNDTAAFATGDSNFRVFLCWTVIDTI